MMMLSRRLPFVAASRLQVAIIRQGPKMATAASEMRREYSSSSSSSGGDNTTLILHAAGQDRLGIVSDVTGLVIQYGGNVGDSFSGRLGPHYFSLMMLVSGIKNTAELETRIRDLPGLQSAVFTVEPVAGTASPPPIAYAGTFTLEGADNPGIVHKVTSLLAQSGLSIDRLQTDQEIAPYGGTVLFKMRGRAVATAPLPKSFDASAIQDRLAQLGDDLNCEIRLEDESSSTSTD